MSSNWSWWRSEGNTSNAWLLALLWTIWWWRGMLTHPTLQTLFVFVLAVRITLRGIDTRQAALVIVGTIFMGVGWLPPLRVPDSFDREAARMTAIWVGVMLALLPWGKWLRGLRARGAA